MFFDVYFTYLFSNATLADGLGLYDDTSYRVRVYGACKLKGFRRLVKD